MLLELAEGRCFLNTSNSTMDEEPIVFEKELEHVINDIKFGVDIVEQSSVLQPTDDCAYMNLRTKEMLSYCVQLTTGGFRVSVAHCVAHTMFLTASFF